MEKIDIFGLSIEALQDLLGKYGFKNLGRNKYLSGFIKNQSLNLAK